MLNWYKAPNLPRVAGVEISDIYVGAATDDTPIPKPPMKRKKENEYGPGARAEPMAEMVNKSPIQINTFFLPYFSVGMPPKIAPTTVPHKAMDIMKKP